MEYNGTTHTILGFDIDSASLTITLPDAKIAVVRVLFDRPGERQGSHSLEVVTLQKVRGEIDHFRAASAMWKFLTAPIDLLLQYTDGRVVWVNCRVPEVWVAFWNSLSTLVDLMKSEQQWRHLFRGSLVRLLIPEQRLSVHLGRVSSRFLPDQFGRASVGETLEVAGAYHWGEGDRHSPLPGRGYTPFLSANAQWRTVD